MAGSVATARGIITDVIAALDGWNVSRCAPDQFSKDTDAYAHKSFVVGCPETQPHARDGRQRVAEGLLVTTPFEIGWMYRIRGDAQAADYDNGLDAEQELVSAVKAISGEHITVGPLRRRTVPQGFMIGAASISMLHRYALT